MYLLVLFEFQTRKFRIHSGFIGGGPEFNVFRCPRRLASRVERVNGDDVQVFQPLVLDQQTIAFVAIHTVRISRLFADREAQRRRRWNPCSTRSPRTLLSPFTMHLTASEKAKRHSCVS